MWWCLPGRNFTGGSRVFGTVKDERAMMYFFPKHRYLWIYVQQKGPDHPLGVCSDCGWGPGGTEVEDEYSESDSDSEGEDAIDWQKSLLDENSDKDSDSSYSPDSENEDVESQIVDSDYEVEDDDNLANNFSVVDIDGNVINGQPTLSGREMGMDEDNADSDLADSDELHITQGDSDEELDNSGQKWPVFNPAVDMKNPVFKMGMLFASVEEFKDAIKEYSISNRVKLSFTKNDPSRVRAICKGRSACPYLIYGRWISMYQSLQVRSMKDEHTCIKEDVIKWVTYKYLGKRFMDRFEADPSFSLNSFADTVEREMQLQIPRSKLSRARAYARQLIHGVDKQQYAQLWDYAKEIRTQMRGSAVYLVPRMTVFDKMFICLDPLKRGFLEGCMPVIFLDGCHIKTSYSCHILTVVGIDANDCIYLFAIAIVEVKETASWKWFLSSLKEDLNIENTYSWTLMSGRQKGLIATIKDQFPEAEHRFCVRHLYLNFQAIFKGEGLKREVWVCARASYPAEFELKMNEIKELGVPAFEWLSGLDPEQWTRAHFREYPKCDVLLNNISECFNKYILNARSKPILSMLESIRCQLMKRMYDKSVEAAKFRSSGKYCPKIIKKLNRIKVLAAICRATSSGVGLYEVRCHEGQLIVDLQTKTCTCKRWQLTGIPCAHSVPAICNEGHSTEDYIHDSYSVEKYGAAYMHPVKPVINPKMWERIGYEAIAPPVYTKKPRRPKKARRKSAQERAKGSKVILSGHGIGKRCRACGGLGHNLRTCLAAGNDMRVPHLPMQGVPSQATPSQPIQVPSQVTLSQPSQVPFQPTPSQPSQVPHQPAPSQPSQTSNLTGPATQQTTVITPISSQYIQSWMPDGSMQYALAPQRMPPATFAYIAGNSVPPPSGPTTTATKRGRAALCRSRQNKLKKGGTSASGKK